MDKLISVGSHDPLGNPRFHLIYPRESMAKMASSDRDGAMDLSIMPDELARFWRDYDPDFDSYAFAHINIVSAFEYYGPNNNGDGFKEEHIYGDGYYRTFESGHPFLLHNNKDPKYSIGKVIATGYNLKMHRIEVITRLDKKNTKSIEIIARIRSGRFPDVSMGCRVPYDVCSICGKKARTRDEYCDHAEKHMLQYYPYDDMTNRGLITCVFNTKPTFFDQSFVFTRADKGTFVIQELNKAAGLIGTSYHFIGHSVDAGSRFFKEAERKKAEMEKTSPDDITRNVKVVDKEKYISDGNSNAVMPEFPLSTCKALSKCAMEDMFDTAGLMGIHIMPKEYAVIKAYKENDAPKAEVIKRHVRVMIAPKTASVTQLPIRAPRYNYEVARVLKPFMSSRSFLPRFDNTRAKGASLTKEAAQLPCVSHEYTRQVLSTFESIRSWEGEFYKNASLVVAGQSDIHEFVNGNETKTDPKVAASRVGGAYMAFFGLRPSEK